MKTRQPASLDAHLGFWLRLASGHVTARFRDLLSAHDATMTATEWAVLRKLYDKTQTTHAELIDLFGVTKGALSKIVTRLEEKGWARRDSSVEGRTNEQILSLTDAGRRLVPKLAALADENEEHFFGHLSGKERDALKRTLQGLIAQHNLRKVRSA